LFWKVEQQYDLSVYQTVVVTKYFNQSRHGPESIYKIDLRTTDGAETCLEIESDLSAGESFSAANTISKFLNIPMIEIEEEE